MSGGLGYGHDIEILILVWDVQTDRTTGRKYSNIGNMSRQASWTGGRIFRDFYILVDLLKNIAKDLMVMQMDPLGAADVKASLNETF